jgi:hypothetical protein
MPWAWLQRCSHLETVLGWQPSRSASSGTLAPSQLAVMMRARWIRLAGHAEQRPACAGWVPRPGRWVLGRTAAAWPCGPPRPPGGGTTNTRRTANCTALEERSIRGTAASPHEDPGFSSRRRRPSSLGMSASALRRSASRFPRRKTSFLACARLIRTHTSYRDVEDRHRGAHLVS